MEQDQRILAASQGSPGESIMNVWVRSLTEAMAYATECSEGYGMGFECERSHR